jgi:hypothetical protein
MARSKRDSVLPPARLHKEELEWLKMQANQRDMSLSAYLRLRLLHPGKLRRVSTRRREKKETQDQKNARHLPPREQSATDCGYRAICCIHDFPLYANGATLCPICSKSGLQLRW